jgi:hypothetical protein
MEIAKTLADVLNRNIRPNKDYQIDDELMSKGIGYSDYLN